MFTPLFTYLFTDLLTIFVNKSAIYWLSIFIAEFPEETEGSHDGNGRIVEHGTDEVDGAHVDGGTNPLSNTHVLGCGRADEHGGVLAVGNFGANGTRGAALQVDDGFLAGGKGLCHQGIGLGVAVRKLQAGGSAGGNGVVHTAAGGAEQGVGGGVVVLNEDFVVNDRVSLLVAALGGADVPLTTLVVQAHVVGFELRAFVTAADFLDIFVGLHIGTGGEHGGTQHRQQ